MKNGRKIRQKLAFFLLIRWFGSLGQSFGIGRTLIFSLIKSLLSQNFCQKRRVNFCNFCTIYVISMVEYTKYVVKRTKNLQKWSFQVYNLHKKKWSHLPDGNSSFARWDLSNEMADKLMTMKTNKGWRYEHSLQIVMTKDLK